MGGRWEGDGREMGGRWEGKDWMTGHDWTDDLSDLAGFGCLLSTQPVGPPSRSFSSFQFPPKVGCQVGRAPFFFRVTYIS